MTAFILAGVLGVIALIVFLLFRQLRQLSWQLTQQRVERDSETILQAIGLRPESPEQESPLAVPTADATLRDRPLPLRHASPLAVALSRLQDLSPRRRYALVASGMIATIAIGLVTLLLVVSSGAAPLGAERVPPAVPTPAESGADPPEPTHFSGQPPDDRTPVRGDVPIAGIDGSELVAETAAVSASPRGWSFSHTPQPSSTQPDGPSQTPPESSVPAGSASPSGTPLIDVCVDVRALLELRLCLGR